MDPSPPIVTNPRAVLLACRLARESDADSAASLAELERLARTLGLEVIGRVTQRREQLRPGTVVGVGKLKELARYTGGSGEVPAHSAPGARRSAAEAEAEEETDAESADTGSDDIGELDPAARAGVVLVDHDLSPSQARNLARATGAEVLDRSAVILAIFQRHARSREARLQVEIARLEYLAPRLREGGGRERQGGGIGGRGAGEKSIELDRRKVRDRIAELRSELARIEQEAGTRRKRRGALPCVALVGYTNAGKSSWMRALTGSGVLVEDKLFATLDTTVRTLQPPTTPPILVSDTVGFIQNLPHDLVASFRSTLDEARDCDLLLHVVDAADPAFERQIEVTLGVLDSIGAARNPRLLLLNKADQLDAPGRERLQRAWPDALLLSTRDPGDRARLHERIVAHFERDMVEAELQVPYARQRVVAEAHANCRVLEEACDEHGTRLRLRARPETLEQLRAGLAADPAAR